MMRIAIASILLLLFNIVSQAQQKDPNFRSNTKVFYDDDYKECKEKSATYYLLAYIGPQGIPLQQARLFKIKKNVLVWEGEFYLYNREQLTKSKYRGNNTWFHSNGKKARESFFKDGKLDGKTTYYNDGGNVIYTAVHIDGKLDGGKMVQHNDDGTTSKVYIQGFDAPYDSWEEEDSKEGKSYLVDGTFKLESKSKDGYKKLEYIPMETQRDFSIETVIDFGQKNDNVIILYGYKDMQNYYGITVAERGYIKLTHYFEGINLSSGQWLKANLNKDWNNIKILKMGEELYVSVNGNVVTNYKFSKFYGSYFGYYLFDKKQELAVNAVMAKEFPYNSSGNSESSSSRSSQGSTRPSTITEVSENSGTIRWRASGSGFYIASNGLLVTNYHVVEGAKNIGVTQYNNGRKNILKAKVILTDEQNDLAVLQIEDSKFISPGQVPYVISTLNADVGESIFTMGYPLTDVMGDEVKITDGIISSRSGLRGDTRVYQITAPITFGNSGGPLFDKDGNLLGMNTSGITKKDVAENTGYAIKSTLIVNLLSSLNDPPKIAISNSLKGKLLKDQIKLLRNFVPMICVGD